RGAAGRRGRAAAWRAPPRRGGRGAAGSAAGSGRLGTCVQEFGTLASWGVDLVNILTGNLDRAGGAMFTTPAAPLDAALPPRPFTMGRWRSRVSGQPEVEGLIPSSTRPEGMLTPGPGRGRARCAR